jgi:hypothetical protein
MRTTVRLTESSPTTTAKRVSKNRQLSKYADLPTFKDVKVQHDSVFFSLSDGRTITIPLAWSKPLSMASVPQRNNFTVSAYNVFWDDIDEIIGVENVLFGKELYL